MPAKTSAVIEHPDGRRARGERTRLRVLDALLALVAEGELRPTAQEVAERAGVALRTVYHHFEDVEALRNVALALQIERHRETLKSLDPKLPLAERIDTVPRQCRKLFEAITPIRLATMFDEHTSLEVAGGVRNSREVRRIHLAETFSPELKAHRSDERTFFDAIDVATSWQTWYSLRNGLNRSASAAERVMIEVLHGLLGSRENTKNRR